MKGFKGTDKNGKCRGFQYEENHDYEFESAGLCHSGGHFCTEPLDVFKYYAPGSKSRYFAVESADEDVSSKTDGFDSKRVTNKLHIEKEIGIKGLIEAHFNLVNNNIHKHIKRGNFEVATGGYKNAATTGKSGIAVTGDWGIATTGECGTAIAGHKGAAKVGENGIATVGASGAVISGDYGTSVSGHYGAAISGHYGVATTGGYSAAIVGNFGTVTAGDYSMATAGECGIATAGYKGMARAGTGGTATTNKCGTAIAGVDGVASAGVHGTAIACDSGVATVSRFGTAVAGKGGTATAGEGGMAIADKDGVAASRGKSSVGVDGSALARGIDVKIRGGLGAILVLVKENIDGNIEDWRAFVIDGENYKPNVWYQLKDGEVVEVQEQNEKKWENRRGLRAEWIT